MAAGWDPASWSGAGSSASPFSGLLGSPVPGVFNLSDYVDPLSTQQTTGQRSTPSVVAGSAEQLQGAGHQQVHSVSDDITEHERDQPWYFYKFVNRYFFDSIPLHFFWKYSFAITLKVIACMCLKVFVCYYTLKVIVCIVLKVFVCYYIAGIRLHCFESIRLLLLKVIGCLFWKVFVLSANIWTLRTLNYELLWTQKLWYELLWGIQSVNVLLSVCVSWTCVLNNENKEL